MQQIPALLAIGAGAAMIFYGGGFFGFLAMCLGALMFIGTFPVISGVKA